MRTTVEIPDEVARRLGAWTKANRRHGEKSAIVKEAVASCLQSTKGPGPAEDADRGSAPVMTDAERERRLQKAMALFGSISEEAAERMHRHVRELREGW